MESSKQDFHHGNKTCPRDERKRKFAAKQQARAAVHDELSTRPKNSAPNQRKMLHPDQDEWILKYSRWVRVVTVDDVQQVKSMIRQQSLDNSTTTGLELEPSLLYPYLDLQTKGERMRVTHDDNFNNSITGFNNHNHHGNNPIFIAEGTETIRLLVQQCTSTTLPIPVVSIFIKANLFFEQPVQLIKDVENIIKTQTNQDSLKEQHHQQQDQSQTLFPFQILIASSEAAISEAAGFPVSRGCLACGIVPRRDQAWLWETFLSKWIHPHKDDDGNHVDQQLHLLALDGVCDTANLGSIIRTASALGIHAIIMSKDCCDAWYRRSIRVSMGHIFRIPCIRMEDDLDKTIRMLRQNNVISFAAVADTRMGTALKDMKSVPRKWCCVMGNEGNGISQKVIEACDHPIHITMAHGVDSLSLPIATGIILNGFREREQTT
jgi:tRNA(Leu) C34 or U34 (ribose-2'-O)-methylase TrmL